MYCGNAGSMEVELGTFTANKAFRIRLARMQRIVVLLINNLHTEVRKDQLKSIINQADSQLLAARKFANSFEDAASLDVTLNCVLDPLRDALPQWLHFLEKQRDVLDQYSRTTGDLDGQPRRVYDEIKRELESLAERLAELHGLSKSLENTSASGNGTDGN